MYYIVLNYAEIFLFVNVRIPGKFGRGLRASLFANIIQPTLQERRMFDGDLPCV